MSEQQEKQESQKTLVAFIAGLLIGGLLVWVFGGSPETTTEVAEESQNAEEVSQTDTPEGAEAEDEVTTEVAEVELPVLTTGDGEVTVNSQPAGSSVTLDSAVFPSEEGWVAVRSYPNGQLGSILGAARYSKEQGLVPEVVELLAPTTAGRDYAVVFFTEDGDREFNLATDVQIDGALGTFTAQ